MAIRQVTQLNQGKKTAGIDGMKSLNFLQRFQLEMRLEKHTGNWKHQGLREIPIPKKDGTTRMLKVPTVCSYCTSNQDSLGIFCLTLLFPYGRAFYSKLKEQL
ncbi:hypothetical protein DSM106972_062320 [Dulcicalothrix desertica PCC 7102]|uniref:Reverse transcriptase N-terminal domain-containing protein n=1 Tax=Dulcicalothrix desertica PCC 7102 TaxID=232991 RepID=A0A433V7W1_9CYAN|nr:hypothetical protein DSM106972_062320 [Dulcicalothrix desertica PCC 7102]